MLRKSPRSPFKKGGGQRSKKPLNPPSGKGEGKRRNFEKKKSF